jgi:peptidyl-prolyl cis-trans isomerase D
VLKFIRRNAEALWVKVIFGAIVFVFIIWGMGGIVGGEKVPFAARVNGQVIDSTEFARTYNNLLRIYQDVYKDNFKPEMLKTLDLKQRAIDQIVQTTLIMQEAERIGLQVGEPEIRDAIKGVPAFQQNGAFDKELYVRVLRANGLTPAEFEESERQELLVKKVQDLIFAGVHVSEAELRDRYRFDNEKIDLRFIKFDAPAFFSDVKLTDEEVQAYYDKNPDTFREPARVKFEYVLYPPEKFADQAEVADADVQRYYEEHQSSYEKPEQVHARHILFTVANDATPEAKAAVRQRAEAELAKIKAGEDFATLAQNDSQDSSAAQGGDLGFFTRGKMVRPFEDAAFALSPGQVSDVVESQFGFHLIKVEERQDAHTQTVDEVRAQIVETLKKDKTQMLARQRADADRAKAAGGTALATVAEAAGLSVVTPAPISQTERIDGVGRSADLTKAAFATAPGDVGPVVESPTGSVLFKVTEKIDAHVPALADIRDRVEEKLRTERAQALAKTKAEAALAELRKSDIDSVATANNLKVEETGPFTRRGDYVPELGSAPELAKDAFELTTAGAAAPAVYVVRGSSVIAALKERIPADDEKFDADKETRRRQTEERRKQQTLEEFTNYLKARPSTSIEIGQEFLASISETGQPFDDARRRR